MRRLPSGVSSTASPGLTWASSRGSARSVRNAKPVLPVSSTKMLTGALLPSWAGTVFSPAATQEHLEPVDVALGDPVRRVEREGGLVVLARRAELAELPERLGQPVLGLGVGAELEQPAVRLGGLGPLGGGRLGDRLLGQLALLAGQVDRALGAVVSTSGKVTRRSSFRGAAGSGAGRSVQGARARGGAWADMLSSTVRPARQTTDRRALGQAARAGRDRYPRASSRFQATTTIPRPTSSNDLPRSSAGRAGARAPCR